MNLAASVKMTADSFLHWVQKQEGRYELKNGHIVMMHGGTRGHARTIQMLAITLSKQLDLSQWTIAASDFAVRIGGDIRYPDLIIERTTADTGALSSDSPVLIAEVLSPSSLALDLNVKAAEYMSLSSLQTYIVAAQDEPRLWLWQRGADGAFPKEPEEVFGKDQATAIACLGVSLPLAEVYLSLPEA
ncbi:MAG: Uma2 family endonuclease [Hyphomicrobiales bacterium]|nr:Uma2 family endonuclease [Hyphomicrobiales bacterium]